MPTKADALRVLEETSRTFYIPISRLPKGLQEAVASGYLSMRSIDEIEDHPDLSGETKASILRQVSECLQAQTAVSCFDHRHLTSIFEPYADQLPEVSLRLGEWACYAPEFIAPRIWEATSSMADRMASWAENGFEVLSKADLDRYTYGVAGAVGLMLCDLFAWFETVQIDRSRAIQFGRGLQLVNILRNRQEDIERGVDFYPDGWTDEQVMEYARQNLIEFDEYLHTIHKTTFFMFVGIPRALALATLDAISRGEEKLSRREVIQIVADAKFKV